MSWKKFGNVGRRVTQRLAPQEASPGKDETSISVPVGKPERQNSVSGRDDRPAKDQRPQPRGSWSGRPRGPINGGASRGSAAGAWEAGRRSLRLKAVGPRFNGRLLN